ncbi:MAG: beta-ketoacyl synthase N-terminal-like domain-containing protein [Bacteroidetes bacterium]|nr:beta-ketoacyl synthase N-terminal-like domain-containing protein [Bacteroidota bacterium]
MKDVFIVSDNILSPIGTTTTDNFEKLKKSVSGIELHEKKSYSETPFYASLFDDSLMFDNDTKILCFTKFENLIINSIRQALLNDAINIDLKKTLLIISSTKGNIELLENEKYTKELINRISLHTSATKISNYFELKEEPLIISNACISGLLAIITGMRMIQIGKYENVIIAGADVISKFVLSGFQSFQAISKEKCRPFDNERNGINLGEGAATIILSSNKKIGSSIKVAGGSVSNDANHISGPSRTGEELSYAISMAMKNANVSNNNIDFISAHGTGTIYNDEMEGNAFFLQKLQNIPTNSLKGYFGHTLGAAGIIESIISYKSMEQNLILPTLGFQKLGISKPINICTTLNSSIINNCLKTASGFGGCNAAIVMSKN